MSQRWLSMHMFCPGLLQRATDMWDSVIITEKHPVCPGQEQNWSLPWGFHFSTPKTIPTLRKDCLIWDRTQKACWPGKKIFQRNWRVGRACTSPAHYLPWVKPRCNSWGGMCARRKTPGLRQIALSVLFLEQLWRWRISLHSQPGLSALEQWQAALGDQKCWTRTSHPFPWSQSPVPVLCWRGADILAAKLSSPEAGWSHPYTLLATVPRPCCSSNWSQKCFNPLSPAN